MKHFAVLLLLIGLPLCGMAEWRTLTSADGSKEIEAELMEYDSTSKVVTLKMRDGRKLTAPATAFSEPDQAYFQEVGLASELGRNLWVEFEDAERVVSDKRNPVNGYQTKTMENGFRIEIRNNGDVPFGGLTARYQIFYAAYRDPFGDVEKEDRLHRGEVAIPELAPREETNLETEAVGLTSIRQLPLSECVGGT